MKVRLKKECQYCGSVTGTMNEGDMHNKLSCDGCGKYIKFISKSGMSDYKKIEVSEPMDEHQEINFKLDLIIEHLGIINQHKDD